MFSWFTIEKILDSNKVSSNASNDVKQNLSMEARLIFIILVVLASMLNISGKFVLVSPDSNNDAIKDNKKDKKQAGKQFIFKWMVKKSNISNQSNLYLIL